MTHPSQPTLRSTSHTRIAQAAIGVSAVLVLAACMPADARTDQAAGPTSSQAVISVRPDGNMLWRPDRPIKVAVVAGTLGQVSVQSTAGKRVVGSLNKARTRWTSKAPMLAFNTRYVVRVKAVDSADVAAVRKTTFRTQKATALVHTFITPGNGSLVGVGMPIIVSFDHPISNKAAAESQLSVTTKPAQAGSWYWVGNQMVRWRPKTYWDAGTKVNVSSALAGTRLGKGVWGDTNQTVDFRIGDAMISTVDIGKHTLTVRRNGQVLRTIPVTTGKPGWDTRQGIKVIMAKQPEITMDAATLNVPRNSPDYYRLKVQWTMRVTWSGEFLHAAPWSVADQGINNVSHGCTGMSTANAQWLYSVSNVGDVVDFADGVRSLEPWNGYTDWNIPWSQWKQGSALN